MTKLKTGLKKYLHRKNRARQFVGDFQSNEINRKILELSGHSCSSTTLQHYIRGAEHLIKAPMPCILPEEN
jgi:hypothetical protein